MLAQALQRPIAVGVFFFGGIVLGIFALFNMPMEVIPSVDYPRLYITTNWPGASPAMVEAEITAPIEGIISQVKGIHKIKSYSRVGFSQIEVFLQKDVDVDYIRFFLQERLSTIQEQLPGMAYPPRIESYIPEELRGQEFLSYHVVGPYSDARLRELALQKIIPILNGIPGVSGAMVRGGRNRQIVILFDEAQLRRWQLHPYDILRTLKQANLTRTLGHIIQGQQKIRVFLNQNIPTINRLENLPILYSNGTILRLKDVATIHDTLTAPLSIMRINGEETVLIVLEREPSSNTIHVANRVYEVIEHIQQQLPRGVKLLKEDDQSEEIRQNMRSLFYRASFSFLVVLLVLSVFIRDIRVTFLVQFSIIISVLCTLFLLFIFRQSLNLITLAGLALGFGVLVDNAIVVSENILRLRELGFSRERACIQGVREVFSPVLAATLTTVVALVPFLYFMESLRLYYLPFAITVSTSLFISMLVSFGFIPVAIYQLWNSLPAPTSNSGSTLHTLQQKLLGRYQVLLGHSMRRPFMVILLFIWIFGIPFWKLPDSIEFPQKSSSWLKTIATTAYNQVMGSDWMQTLRPYLNHILGGSHYLFYHYVSRGELWQWGEQTRVQVYARLPSGTAIEETDKVARLLERTILGNQGIQQVRTTVFSDKILMTVTFLPEYEYSVVPYVVKQKLITRATRIGNTRISVFGYGPGFSSGGQAMTTMNRLLLRGYNYADLETISEHIKERLEQYPRVRNIRTDLIRGWMPSDVWEMGLALSFLRMNRYHLNSRLVINQLQPYVRMQLYRQRLRMGFREIPFTLQAQSVHHLQFNELAELQITNAKHQLVRVGDVAQVYRHRIPPIIERENQQYYRIIAFEYLAPWQFASQFVDNFVEQTTLPPGYQLSQEHYSWKTRDDQLKNILFVLTLGLVFMYMVLAALYESLLYPFIIFLILPLSLVGVFLIYYLGDYVFSSSSYIGLIFLFGITLNNSIILLDHILYHAYRNPQQDLREIILHASTERVRPILMTTATTVLGMLPIVIFQTGNTTDIWYNLAISTIGGLIAGTLLGLIGIPVFVWLFFRWKAKK